MLFFEYSKLVGIDKGVALIGVLPEIVANAILLALNI